MATRSPSGSERIPSLLERTGEPETSARKNARRGPSARREHNSIRDNVMSCNLNAERDAAAPTVALPRARFSEGALNSDARLGQTK